MSCGAVAGSVRDFYNSTATQICSSPWEVREWELLHEPKKPMRDFGSYLQPHMGLSLEDTSLYSEQGGEQGAMGLNAQERFGLEVKREKRAKQM